MVQTLVPLQYPGKSNRRVCVVGAPVSFGQTKHGVNKAPKALRDKGLHHIVEKLSQRVHDVGDLPFRQASPSTDIVPCSLLQNRVVRQVPTAEYTEEDIPNCRLIGEASGQIAEATAQAARRGDFVLTLGGDHSVAAGSISGLLDFYPDLVVIWVDAHGDLNTPETSPSHSYHGMPVAHLLGLFSKRAPGFEWMNHVPTLNSSNLAFIGLRDLDPEECQLIQRLELSAFSMQHIDRSSISAVMKEALRRIDPLDSRPIHLSFDIDACDPSIAPGTGTKARGGLSYREAHCICEILHETGRLVSMDMVEVNPDLDFTDEIYSADHHSWISLDATKTVRLGLELISSALGKAIV